MYETYWRELKFFVDELGLDWVFSSFEDESQAVVRIGAPKYKICLSLLDPHSRNISAGFWIPDSREDFAKLKAQQSRIEAEMGKQLVWDSKPGRKSSWIRITAAMDIAQEANWPASFEWFAMNAGKIRDVCHKYLG